MVDISSVQGNHQIELCVPSGAPEWYVLIPEQEAVKASSACRECDANLSFPAEPIGLNKVFILEDYWHREGD